MTDAAPVVTIDGPSGSGKGTVSRRLAARLGWHLLDSGALYRLVALACEDSGVELSDETSAAAVAGMMTIAFGRSGNPDGIFLEGRDVTDLLRTESCGQAASRVARLSAVRAVLLERQRGFARLPGLVADGRDMGTVVFPAAVLKVFLTASAEERAMRRHKQLNEKGIDVSLPDLSKEISQRDLRDASRPVAPLRPAKDARVVDSTGLTPDEVVARMLGWLSAAGVDRD
jgi:cytidylate kinase